MTNNENLDFDKSDNAKSIHHIYFYATKIH